jgi:diguanylate cyclase (GGDEF)-like protein
MLGDFKHDETGRIKALERLDILDTPREKPFENIVQLVEQVLQVPICAVTLIDEDRQWFKASRGLEMRETPREVSFCTHAIKTPEPLLVRDMLSDARFVDNPFVAGEPHIRSYAGVPLQTSDGYLVGTICALDTKTRQFPAEEIDILKNFAKLVVDELELRRVASTDLLTNALSRRAWIELAEAEVKRSIRYSRPLSLAVLDIDHFKLVNDAYGHSAGDMVIKELGKITRNSIRETDLFGRYGGEEFVLLLSETPISGAFMIAERVRELFSSLVIAELGGAHATLSIGLTHLRGENDSLEDMINRADSALYEAKRSGRNCTISNPGES